VLSIIFAWQAVVAVVMPALETLTQAVVAEQADLERRQISQLVHHLL
jgi:hypothetical protein